MRPRLGCAPTVRPDLSRAVTEGLWGGACLGVTGGRDVVARALARGGEHVAAVFNCVHTLARRGGIVVDRPSAPACPCCERIRSSCAGGDPPRPRPMWECPDLRCSASVGNADLRKSNEKSQIRRRARRGQRCSSRTSVPAYATAAVARPTRARVRLSRCDLHRSTRSSRGRVPSCRR